MKAEEPPPDIVFPLCRELWAVLGSRAPPWFYTTLLPDL